MNEHSAFTLLLVIGADIQTGIPTSTLDNFFEAFNVALSFTLTIAQLFGGSVLVEKKKPT